MDSHDAHDLWRAVDGAHLCGIARHWSKSLPADRATPEAAFRAYLADPRCRKESPNPIFAEGWYRQRHDDVDRAVREGTELSGFAHFVRRGVFEGRPYNAYVERRMAWCTEPAPAIADDTPPADPRDLDDESRTFLEGFPHVSSTAYHNAYGRFLRGTAPGAAPLPGRPRTALLVLGMHRSGTSSLAGSLAAAGASLGSDLIPVLPENPKGHWESREIIRTADAILARANSRWDDVRPVVFPDAQTRGEAVGDIVALLDRKFPRSGLIAVKDPRACRLASIWCEALAAVGFAVRVVVPVRDPHEVAASLAARNGFPTGTGLALWMRHVLDALRMTRGLPRTLVDYGNLLAHGPAEIDRIGAALGVEWPVAAPDRASRIADFLEPGLRRQREVERPSIPHVEALWALVSRGDDALGRAEATGALEAIEAEFDRSLGRGT